MKRSIIENHLSTPKENPDLPGIDENVQALTQEFVDCRKDVIGPNRRRAIHSIISKIERRAEKNFASLELRAKLWREMTREARSQGELSLAWKETLSAVEALTTSSISTESQKGIAYQTLVEWSIDFAQSEASHVGINTTLAQLNQVRQYLGRQIGTVEDQSRRKCHELGEVFCLRAKCTRAIASLLRRRGDSSKEVKLAIDAHKYRALRDAERGHELANSERSQLELALCLFASSGTPASDSAKRGMELLITSVQSGAGPLTRYELVKQYRLRYEFLNAIQTFNAIADPETRRFHSNVTHLASAVIGLYYEKGAPDIAKDHALNALPWIEELIAQDRHIARDIVDLCFLKAISGWSTKDCVAPLENFKPTTASTWNEVVVMAKRVSEGDIGNALLLGLEDPVVWSRIGSFYSEFVQDYETAAEFYERAIIIAPLSPVFHFSKAEVLAYGLHDYKSAKASFDYSKRLKHRSYAWYKSIPEKIERLRKEISKNLDK